MFNADMFQTFVDQADEIVGTDSGNDRTIGLFHVLAGALDWCATHGVDFDATLAEVRLALAQ